MSLEQFKEIMLPVLEDELKEIVRLTDLPGYEELYRMLVYHMGWENESLTSTSGKRIRPLLVLLSVSAAGGDWKKAVPAAAAIELIHNFSLIHDDIQDSSELRRGRATVWKLWGVPQAINTGDMMFTLAQTAILKLKDTTSLSTTVQASQIFQKSCLQLTQGQYLDMSYESQDTMEIGSYWKMIEGKTAALLAASTEIGALCGNVDNKTVKSYRDFGYYLGLAFQTQDDLLGIWGNTLVTGKSAESDLSTGKKTLPILFGLGKKGDFYRGWKNQGLTIDEIPTLASMLENEGAKEFTEIRTEELTEMALTALDNANPTIEAGTALKSLAQNLLNRRV
jgi:geranylgeranyl diphosphate synthase type I